MDELKYKYGLHTLNLEHIKAFIGYYHKDDYVYDQVIHREFNDSYDDVVNYLVDNNIVEVSERLVCPECRQFIPERDFCGEVVCYHCGKIYSVDSVIHKKVFIKL